MIPSPSLSKCIIFIACVYDPTRIIADSRQFEIDGMCIKVSRDNSAFMDFSNFLRCQFSSVYRSEENIDASKVRKALPKSFVH